MSICEGKKLDLHASSHQILNWSSTLSRRNAGSKGVNTPFDLGEPIWETYFTKTQRTINTTLLRPTQSSFLCRPVAFNRWQLPTLRTRLSTSGGCQLSRRRRPPRCQARTRSPQLRREDQKRVESGVWHPKVLGPNVALSNQRRKFSHLSP